VNVDVFQAEIIDFARDVVCVLERLKKIKKLYMYAYIIFFNYLGLI